MLTNIKQYRQVAFGLALCCSAVGFAHAGETQPGKRGEDLQKYAGIWDIKAVIRSSKSEAPVEIAGVAEKKVVGDRWIISNFQADFFGVKFSGQDFYGYDENAGNWKAVWVDSMNDRSIEYTSVTEPDGEFFMKGRSKDPSSGEWVVEKRTDVWRNANEFDTNFVIVLPDGTEYQSLSIKHKRKTPAPT